MLGADIASTVLGSFNSLFNAFSSGIVNNQNYNLSKESFKYQKWLNSQYLDRMDNRLSYLKKDAANAGVNLLSALGQGGNYSPLAAGVAPRQEPTLIDKLNEVIPSAVGVAKTIADIKVAKSVENLNNSQSKSAIARSLLDTQLIKKHKQDLWYAKRHDIPTSVLPRLEQELFRDVKNIFINSDGSYFNRGNMSGLYGSSLYAPYRSFGSSSDNYFKTMQENKSGWSEWLDNLFFGFLENIDKKLRPERFSNK